MKEKANPFRLYSIKRQFLKCFCSFQIKNETLTYLNGANFFSFIDDLEL